MENYDAARKAATRYSSDWREAVKEYATLTDQVSLISSEDGCNSLREEMTLLLPAYRHPMGSYAGEYQTFVDIDCLRGEMIGYSLPPFFRRLKESNIDDSLLAEINQYVKDSELRGLELNKYKAEADRLRELVLSAEKIYNDNRDKRSDQRNTLVVQFLGFSGGVPIERIDKQRMYFDYMLLVRHQGVSRKEATETLKKKYGILSFDATLKHLHSSRQALLQSWEQRHPTLLPTIKNYLEGYVLSRR